MASDPLHAFKSIILYYNHQIHNMLILGPSDSLIPYKTKGCVKAGNALSSMIATFVVGFTDAANFLCERKVGTG